MTDIGQAVGVDPMQWVLTGGEDHAIVATFPPDVKLPARWRSSARCSTRPALPQVTVDGAPWDQHRAAGTTSGTIDAVTGDAVERSACHLHGC